MMKAAYLVSIGRLAPKNKHSPRDPRMNMTGLDGQDCDVKMKGKKMSSKVNNDKRENK